MLNTEEPLWTLDELCVAAQNETARRQFPNPGGRVASTLNGRTVRYYATLGLVDKPSTFQNGTARYGLRHLLQLVAIKALQAQFLPLPEIQKRLYGRTTAELQAALDALPAPQDVVDLDSWLTCSPVPGLRLVVEDREAFLDWVRAHRADQLQDRLAQALALLQTPNQIRRTTHGANDT